MAAASRNPIRNPKGLAICLLVSAMLMHSPLCSAVDKNKKKKDAAPPQKSLIEQLDNSKIVWPNPPAIARIKYLDFFASEKPPTQATNKKGGWMDRLSGVATGETKADRALFQLAQPYGVAVDSKKLLYVADSKVGAIFIFNTENKDLDLIKNGVHARFGLITGLAIDDSDRLFVSDSVLRHVLVMNPQHKVEGAIAQGMSSPAGIAIDNENRFLYVADTDLDQVLVYDADPPYKLIRKMGTSGKGHRLTSPGDFSRPTNVAVTSDGDLYVSDTFNDRVEVFDADGNFIRTFGKAGDGPGYFARPKGLAIDADGHVWVADTVQDRVQVFDREGRLLIWFGGHGILPGQFSAVQGLTIDKDNRVFTSEQYPGRVQAFRYVTNDEAMAEKNRRDADEQKKSAGAKKDVTTEAVQQKPETVKK
jgi:DNA-binding beta-propeller fold protein YncE